MDKNPVTVDAIMMGAAFAGMFAAFAIARLVAAIRPPKDGRPDKIAAYVSVLCVVAVLLFSVIEFRAVVNALGFLG
ncbi:MAG: hypothetical protein ACHQ50_01035 [Fimbriimonadales bacterium]